MSLEQELLARGGILLDHLNDSPNLSRDSLHHTLGIAATQASPGDHIHKGDSSSRALPVASIPALPESKITSLPTDLSNLQNFMGGGNMQPQSSCRKYPDGITPQGGATIAAAGSLWTNARLWQVTIPTPSGPTDYYKGWVAKTFVPMQVFGAGSPVENFIYACKIYVGSGTPSLYFRYTALSSTGTYLGEGGLTFTPSPGGWQILVVTILASQLPAGTCYINLSMQFPYVSGSPQACMYFIDEIQFENGKFLSAYAPSAHDPGWSQVTSDIGWNGLTLQNSWVYYGSPYPNPAYLKDAAGVVQLKGLIKSGTTTSGTTIATLPVGYRPYPTEQRIFSVASNDAFGEIRIDGSNGNINTSVVSNVWLSLDNISFYAGVSIP